MMASHRGKRALLAAALAALVLAGCSGLETRAPAQRDGEGAAPSREISQEAGSSAPAEEEPPAASSSPAREAPAEEPDPGELLARWEEWEALAATGEYPWTTDRGTQNLALLEDWVQALQAGEPAALTGLTLGNTTPLVYRLEAGSQGVFCTLYYPTQEGQPREERQALTAVWNGDGFLRFEGEAGGFSLLLEQAPVREEAGETADPSALPVTWEEARERAVLLEARLSTYWAAGGSLDRSGLLLPAGEALPAVSDASPQPSEAEALSTVDGVPCYEAAFFQEGSPTGTVILVSGETGKEAYLLEQANGTLVPLVLEEEAELLWPAP